MNFEGYIKGPENSCYNSKIYRVMVKIDEDFPAKPPKIYFVDTMFHPNVDFNTGEICADILKENWNPQFNLDSVMNSIHNLLVEPNHLSPLNVDAGRLKSKFT